MRPVAARQSPRIDYRIPVQLAPPGAPFEPGAMAGRSINVSEGGMAVGVPALLDVGEHVVCHLFVDGKRASLGGEVTWAEGDSPDPSTEAGEAGARVGIRFDDLSGAQSDLLGRLLSTAVGPGVPVALRFEGMQGQVVARGVVGDERVRLSAALPILAMGARVDFRLSEEGPEFPGEVSDCRITARGKVPVLEVDLTFGDGDGPRTRRRTFYGRASGLPVPTPARPNGSHANAEADDGGALTASPAPRGAPWDPEHDTTPDPVPPVDGDQAAAADTAARERRVFSGPYALPVRQPGWGTVLAAAVIAAAVTWTVLTIS